jgi:hypothetical protein
MRSNDNIFKNMKNYTKNSSCPGFLILEAIIALALFSICIFSTIALSFGSRRMFEEARDKETLLDQAALSVADLSNFDPQFAHADYGNDADIATFSASTSSVLSTSASSSVFGSSSISFNILEPDTFSAYGKDTCPPTLSFSNNTYSSTSAALPISPSNSVTDLSVKDGFAYISTDSSSSTDPDLFIFDMNDAADPKFVSSLNTGPGLAALTVAGPYIFASNKGSIDQLQIIDIHDRSHPMIISQAKVPMDIASSTAPNGSAIFYDKGFVYLGTEKGDSPEFTVWNVADPAHPILAGRYEIGNKVEKIFVDGTRAYVAGTGANQLMIFDVSDPTDSVLLETLAPSGWQTQSGRTLDLFEGELILGRDTGGYNNTANPEFILYDASDMVSNVAITERSSFDEPGGIYGVISRSPVFLVLTHRTSGQFRSDDGLGTTSAAYSILGVPAAMSCDWGDIYVVSNNSSNDSPSIASIKDFHE